MSIQIIDKTKPPAPLYVREPTPTFTTTYESDKYWDEQRRRWIEGYSGLTGLHYFYLQEWHLKLIDGSTLRPQFRDTDLLQAEAFEQCRKNRSDLLVIKRREVGLTSFFGGAAPMWTVLTNPGSTCLLTSCDTGRFKAMFNDKLMFGYNKMHQEIMPPKKRKNAFGVIELGEQYKDERNEWKESDLGKIICKETTVDHTVFESERALYGFVDEGALHGKLSELKASMAACFMRSTQKFGTLVIGGSIGLEKKGSDKSKQNINAIRDLYRDAENVNMITTFLPGTMGLDEFMVNGWSDTKAAKDWIDNRRETLSKANNLTEYNQFIKHYPLSIEEALDYNTESFFDADIVNRINKQEKAILNTKVPIANYRLHEDENGDVQATPDNKNGKFRIFLHPEPNKRYIAGLDAIPLSQNIEEEGSEHCIVIKDFEEDTYVAYYKIRLMNADIVVSDSILLQQYYNDALCMVESNRGGVLMQKYKDFGYYHLLANRPTNLGIKFVDNRVKKGFYKNSKTAPRLYDALIKYMQEHTEKIWFIEFLEELRRFGDGGNYDIVDAMCVCEILELSEIKKNETEYKQPEFKMQRRFVIRNGKTFIEWVKVQTG